MVQFIPILILQWNARRLLSNGRDYKQFIYNQTEKPGFNHVSCIQIMYTGNMVEAFFGLYLDILQLDVIGVRYSI